MTQNVPPGADEQVLPSDHPAETVDTLKQAMRRARADDAERAGARAELRVARLGRLELLQDALQPLLAQIPADVDFFDIALVPSSEPRLFIDMIGFVEMGRDARVYILQQDTRHGRIRVAEGESLEAMVDAVTDYVARRLLERDKALASDAKARASRPVGAKAATNPALRKDRLAEPAAVPEPRRGPRPLRWAGIAFAFLIDLLGAITFFTILLVVAWHVYSRLHPPV